MLKLLTFECAQLQQATVGMIQHDTNAYFDCIYRENTSIFVTKVAVNKELMKYIVTAIDKMERQVETDRAGGV